MSTLHLKGSGGFADKRKTGSVAEAVSATQLSGNLTSCMCTSSWITNTGNKCTHKKFTLKHCVSQRKQVINLLFTEHKNNVSTVL